MSKNRCETITLKVDESLLEAMEGIENRSEFIRSAILTALNNICPLCKGKGLLTPYQQRHWESFAENHSIEECDQCQEIHLVCGLEGKVE
ncbi:MAG: CopG family transcriptional regulator [Planctomycetes bacterium]|nr:CopG family transcriptional regulator [Planctomycetota bacterium]